MKKGHGGVSGEYYILYTLYMSNARRLCVCVCVYEYMRVWS